MTAAIVAPSEAIILYGTEEPAPPPRILRAGGLTAEFEAGNLRHIRLDGVELIRAVSFIVRDRNWGTYNPILEDVRVEESGTGFQVIYRAVAADAVQRFDYRAEIRGSADGRLAFRASGAAATAFVTNRTGFVVLHPILGVSGRPCTVEHVGGEVVEAIFPGLIDPVQPMRDLRAITHEAAPGLRVTCRMEGDAYEMEDQRNWGDASYKTYVRPLARPWPYTLAAGEAVEQSVSLEVAGTTSEPPGNDGAVALSILAEAGRAPRLGVGFDPHEAAASFGAAGLLRAAGIGHLVCHHDPRRGHNSASLEASVEVARACGAEPWLEAVVGSVEGFREEIAELGAVVASIGSPFPVVLVSPASDLKCTLPGSVWPAAPDPVSLFRAARAAFPGARLGGGMFSLFTELNRKRPPVEEVDLVSFTTIGVMHAGDDTSVMEGLESLSAIAATARAIAGPKPYAVGPSAIGMRMNPYGDAPFANPGNIRQAMTYNDPRQRGLLGAAWTLGVYAGFAAGGAWSVTFGDTTGAFGLVHAPQAWPQPWYDEHGGLFPVYHVVRGLMRLAGLPVHALVADREGSVLGLAARRDGQLELWLANVSPRAVEVSLPAPAQALARLGASAGVEASRDPLFMDGMTNAGRTSSVTLAPYEVLRVQLAG